VKFNDFKNMTRSKSVTHWIETKDEWAQLSRELLEEALPLPMPIRLMGLTLSNLDHGEEEEQSKDSAQLSLL
jgi:DNA polymerase-4